MFHEIHSRRTKGNTLVKGENHETLQGSRKKTRNCSNITIYKRKLIVESVSPSRIKKLVELLRNNYPLLFPIYKKGSIVKAHPDSSGVFCFKTINGAKGFISFHSLQKETLIIQVEAIGPIETSEFKFVTSCGSNPEYLSTYQASLGKMKTRELDTPYFHVCSAMSVKVLE